METVTYTQKQLAMLIRQEEALRVRYPCLALAQCGAGRLTVRGEVEFVMEYDGRSIEDEFHIELRIPANYPASPPIAYEVARRLDRFDHLFPDGRLCLGAPAEVRSRFAKRPSLLHFIEDLVVPFLFSFSYKKQYGEMPFGELTHGIKGILDYYTEFFDTPKENAVLLLECLAYGKVPPLERCPCGSGRKLEKCHGTRMNALRPHQTTQGFRNELREIVSACSGDQPHRKLLPRRLRRRIARQLDKLKT